MLTISQSSGLMQFPPPPWTSTCCLSGVESPGELIACLAPRSGPHSRQDSLCSSRSIKVCVLKSEWFIGGLSHLQQRNGSVTIVTRLLHEQPWSYVSIPGTGESCFSSSQCPLYIWAPTAPPVQLVPMIIFSRDKAAGAWSLPLTSIR
jgi:hypothetical protein